MIAISDSELDRIIANLASVGLRAEEAAEGSYPGAGHTGDYRQLGQCAVRIGYLQGEIEAALRTLVAIRTGNASLKEAA